MRVEEEHGSANCCRYRRVHVRGIGSAMVVVMAMLAMQRKVGTLVAAHVSAQVNVVQIGTVGELLLFGVESTSLEQRRPVPNDPDGQEYDE